MCLIFRTKSLAQIVFPCTATKHRVCFYVDLRIRVDTKTLYHLSEDLFPSWAWWWEKRWICFMCSLDVYSHVVYSHVVVPNGLIANLFGPVEGRRHDSGMLAMSGLLPMLENHCVSPTGQPLCVYGDPAYPLRVHLQGPFKGNALTPQQQQYNLSMSKVRTAVEWVFGDILQYFTFLDFKRDLKVVYYLCLINPLPTKDVYIRPQCVHRATQDVYIRPQNKRFSATPVAWIKSRHLLWWLRRVWYLLYNTADHL